MGAQAGAGPATNTAVDTMVATRLQRLSRSAKKCASNELADRCSVFTKKIPGCLHNRARMCNDSCIDRAVCQGEVIAMPPRRCLDCRRLISKGSRCGPCLYGYERSKPGFLQRKQLRNSDRKISKALIAAQPWCQRCNSTEDLTADHIIPISKGGTNDGPRRVLCRSCNSKIGNRGA